MLNVADPPRRFLRRTNFTRNRGREGEVKVEVPLVQTEDNEAPSICPFRVGAL